MKDLKSMGWQTKIKFTNGVTIVKKVTVGEVRDFIKETNLKFAKKQDIINVYIFPLLLQEAKKQNYKVKYIEVLA